MREEAGAMEQRARSLFQMTVIQFRCKRSRSAYVVALVENTYILALLRLCPILHSPMYNFLVNLFLLDICCITTIVPQMLRNLMDENKSISFKGCLMQAYFYLIFLTTELLLLAITTFDRYVAICHPLHYTVIMNWKLCNYLMIGSWIVGTLNNSIHILPVLHLSFCGPSTINHLFCEIPPLIQLSCTDTTVNQYLMLVTDLWGVGCFLLTLVSYIYIVSSVLKLHSVQGKKKAFSTCFSHVMVVMLFYGSVIYTYFRPPSIYTDSDKIAAIICTVITPVLNPFIYTLRNKEVKEALKTLLELNTN
ncbi:PREDICTED: olfactory receptor 1G1-like [Thamnophis sirtalis]|uniref:Olfactory receptor n=1 Tax=Thamnophis sirtalis TaxID=35019 RepID=A0A6I9YAJ1_9SAUR|nr:PREDICTED: olfactory receptor 1G1-like [Thamnophis sirtalis]